MKAKTGPTAMVGGILSWVVAPLTYLVVMIIAGWHNGVMAGAAFCLLGLVLIEIENVCGRRWPDFWVVLAEAAVPTFFMRWGAQVPARDAFTAALFMGVACLIIAGLVWARQKVNKLTV